MSCSGNNLGICTVQCCLCVIPFNALEVQAQVLRILEKYFENILVRHPAPDGEFFGKHFLLFLIKFPPVDFQVIDDLPHLEFLEQRRRFRADFQPDSPRLLPAVLYCGDQPVLELANPYKALLTAERPLIEDDNVTKYFLQFRSQFRMECALNTPDFLKLIQIILTEEGLVLQ